MSNQHKTSQHTEWIQYGAWGCSSTGSDNQACMRLSLVPNTKDLDGCGGTLRHLSAWEVEAGLSVFQG